jgi:hypothetical protein
MPSTISTTSDEGSAMAIIKFGGRNSDKSKDIKILAAYPKQALQRDLDRLSVAWKKLQRRRNRDAIYAFLREVFELVAWWDVENRTAKRTLRVLNLTEIPTPNDLEPYAALIRVAAYPAELDKRSISKWSRVLRYASLQDVAPADLKRFIKKRGGLNICAEKYARTKRRDKAEDLAN